MNSACRVYNIKDLIGFNVHSVHNCRYKIFDVRWLSKQPLLAMLLDYVETLLL